MDDLLLFPLREATKSLGTVPGVSSSEAFASVVVSLAAGLSAGGMVASKLFAGLTGGSVSSSGT